MSEQEPDEVPDEIEELIDVATETWGGEYGIERDRIPVLIEQNIGVDVYDLDPADAERLSDAIHESNIDEIETVAREYDAPEEKIERFREMVEVAADTGSGNGAEPADSAARRPEDVADQAGGGSGSPSRDEVQSMIRSEVEQAVPSAQEIAAHIQQGGGQQQGQGQPSDAQGQNMIAQLIAQKYLGGGGGDTLGQKVQEHATERFIQRAFAPDPGEIMGRMLAMKQYRQMAEEFGFEVDDKELGDMMKNMMTTDIPGYGDDDGDD